MSAGWERFNLEAWINNLVAGYERQLLEMSKRRAKEIEQWMKQNAAWQDQTGDARRLLRAEVKVLAGQIIIEMAHGVPYGDELEHHRSGRYAILAPAMDEFFPKIVEDARKIMNGTYVRSQNQG